MRQKTLREWREKRDLTQDELSARSGVAQTAISKIELGQVANPSIDTVVKLAEALEIDPMALKFGAHDAQVSA